MIAENGRIAVDLAQESAFELGSMYVHPSTRELVVDDRREILEPRIMQVLVALSARRGKVVSREELIALCWGGRSVVDEAIRRCILAIRRLSAAYGGFSVRTVPRVGYRLDEWLASGEASAEAPTRLVAARPQLVGRAKEMRSIRRVMSQALSGAGGVVVAGGPPGIGKTRLAAEVAAEAERQGAMALTGHCYEASEGTPYMPFVELLGVMAQAASPEVFRRNLGEDAAQVAKIFPELRRQFPDIPAPIELPPAQERRYLFNSLRDCLERSARTQPLVLVLEDLHWADDTTVSLLRHVTERLSEIPVLVVATFRNVESELSRALADWLAETVRRRVGTHLTIVGLAEIDTGALIGELIGRDVGPAWIAAVHKATEGNPFFIEELIKHLTEDGHLLGDEERPDAEGAISALGVPDGVRLVVGRRLARLSDDTRRVLTAASIIGNRFDPQILEGLNLGDTEAVFDALDRAEVAGLIRGEATGYRFGHELIRRVITAGLSVPRQRRLHLSIADHMERLYAATLEEHAAEVAHHLVEAGSLARPIRTVRALLFAGNRALKGAAFEQALNHFEAGLSVLEGDPTIERASLLYGRGRGNRRTGRNGQAIQDFYLALDAFDRMGDVNGVALVCIELANEVSVAGRSDEAIRLCKRGLVALGDQRSGERARLLGTLTECLGPRGYDPSGDLALSEAERLAQEIDDRPALAFLFGSRAHLHQQRGDFRQATDVACRAAQIAREVGDVWTLVHCLAVAGGSLYRLGLWSEAEAVLSEGEAFAERSGNSRSSHACRHFLRLIRGHKIGRATGAQDKNEPSENPGVPRAHGSMQLHRALNTYHGGHWTEAAAILEEGSSEGSSDCWSALLITRARLGEADRVDAMLKDSPVEPTGRRSLFEVRASDRGSAVAEALFVLGRKDEAAEFFQPLSSRLESCLVRNSDGRLLHVVAAMAAAASGEWEEAERFFRAALDLAERLPYPVEQAGIRRDWAQALLLRKGRGDSARARLLLREAAQRYLQMGMIRHAAEAGLR